MKPVDIIKKSLKTKPPKGSESDITPPIQVQFFKDEKIVSESEYSNFDFLTIIAKHEGIAKFTGAKITIDDGKKSYTFTLGIDEFVKNKTEINKPMK